MYAGGYSYYKEKAASEEARQSSIELLPKKEKTVAQAQPKADTKRRLTFKEQKEYAEIEAVIASKEGELKVVQLQMTQNASDYSKLNELSREQERLQAELDNLLARWAYLEEVAEEQAK